MKVVEIVLQNSADISIFKMNTNPLRVGLVLYKYIDDM
jgi:hypothetical protein